MPLIFTSTLISLAGTGLGLIVQILIANNFGASANVDAYYSSISVPLFLSGIITSAYMFGVVPIIVGYRKNINDKVAFIRYLIVFSFIVSVIFIFSIGLVDYQLELIGNELKFVDDISNLFVIGWIIGAIQIFCGAFSAILSADKKYYKCSISALFPYIGIIFGIEFYNNILGVSLGLFYGSMASLIFLLCDIVPRYRSYILSIDISRKGYRHLLTILRSSILVIFSLNCFSSYSIIDAYVGPKIGIGSLSILAYSQRIIIGLGALAVVGIFTISGPSFKVALESLSQRGFKNIVIRYGLIAFGSSLLLAIFLYFTIDMLVGIIYSSENISDSDRLSIVNCIRWMLPGMVAMLLSSVLMKAVFCLKNIEKFCVFLGILWPFLYLALSELLYIYGVIGISISYSITWVISFLAITTFLLKYD
jgi:putative peptidoglycan lipid II flippase